MMPSTRFHHVQESLIVIVIFIGSLHQCQPNCLGFIRMKNGSGNTEDCTLLRSNYQVSDVNNFTWISSTEEFTLDLIDPKRGIAKVKYPLAQCEPDIFYQVILQVNESVTTKELCNKNAFSENHVTVHSRKLFHKNRCKIDEADVCKSCNMMYMEAEIRNVFTGCYFLKIAPRPHRNNALCNELLNRYSAPIFVKTDYKKTLMEKPYVDYEYNQEWHVIMFHLTLQKSMASNGQLIIYFPNGTCTVQFDRRQHPNNPAVVALHPNVTMQQCKTYDPKQKAPKCALEGDRLNCIFFNITPGHYCVVVEMPHDDRCITNTIWTEENECIWRYPMVANGSDIQIAPLNKKDVIPNSDNYVYLAVLIEALISVALFFGAFYCGIKMFKNRQSATRTQGVSPVNDIKFQRTKILLLYAQDCQQFMDMMVTFRTILDKQDKFEVYDIYDRRLWNTIAVAHHEWIHKMVSQKDTKIVVVETMSALLHHKALEDNYLINYVQPLPYSRLFTYALQTVMNKYDKDEYNKFFVTRFEGLLEANQKLKHITTFRRYDIPQHLGNLICNLKECSNVDLEYSSNKTIQEVEQLQKQLEMLVSYKNQNPNYLRNILYRT